MENYFLLYDMHGQYIFISASVIRELPTLTLRNHPRAKKLSRCDISKMSISSNNWILNYRYRIVSAKVWYFVRSFRPRRSHSNEISPARCCGVCQFVCTTCVQCLRIAKCIFKKDKNGLWELVFFKAILASPGLEIPRSRSVPNNRHLIAAKLLFEMFNESCLTTLSSPAVNCHRMSASLPNITFCTSYGNHSCLQILTCRKPL
jgi:hypothetical protein